MDFSELDTQGLLRFYYNNQAHAAHCLVSLLITLTPQKTSNLKPPNLTLTPHQHTYPMTQPTEYNIVYSVGSIYLFTIC